MGHKIGVLALQGAVARHVAALADLGASALAVRTPEQLAEVEAIVLPGGESTTMSMLLDSSGLRAPLTERIAGGMPVFGTCAGMILLADEVLDGRADQVSLGVLPIAVRRNAFGRQIDSFEADLPVAGLAEPFHAVFIRAPAIESTGPDVEVLAAWNGRPVLCRRGPVFASAFHPELTDDRRLHELFLQEV